METAGEMGLEQSVPNLKATFKDSKSRKGLMKNEGLEIGDLACPTC